MSVLPLNFCVPAKSIIPSVALHCFTTPTRLHTKFFFGAIMPKFYHPPPLNSISQQHNHGHGHYQNHHLCAPSIASFSALPLAQPYFYNNLPSPTANINPYANASAPPISPTSHATSYNYLSSNSLPAPNFYSHPQPNPPPPLPLQSYSHSQPYLPLQKPPLPSPPYSHYVEGSLYFPPPSPHASTPTLTPQQGQFGHHQPSMYPMSSAGYPSTLSTPHLQQSHHSDDNKPCVQKPQHDTYVANGFPPVLLKLSSQRPVPSINIVPLPPPSLSELYQTSYPGADIEDDPPADPPPHHRFKLRRIRPLSPHS